MENEKILSEKESLELITTMINKARDSYHDTGIGAIMWGAVVAVCSLVKFSEIYFDYRLPFDIYLLTLVAIIPQIYFVIKEKRERKVKSYDDAFMDYLWLAFGICLFLLIHVINLVFNGLEPMNSEFRTLTGHAGSFRFYEYVSPLFLILYGLPTFVTGASFKFKPMLWGGIFCWLCSIVTVYTRIEIDLLLTAVAALLSWFVPGLLMERDYRLAKKEQAQLNV